MTAVTILRCDCPRCSGPLAIPEVWGSRGDLADMRTAAARAGWAPGVHPDGTGADYAPGHAPEGGAPC